MNNFSVFSFVSTWSLYNNIIIALFGIFIYLTSNPSITQPVFKSKNDTIYLVKIINHVSVNKCFKIFFLSFLPP